MNTPDSQIIVRRFFDALARLKADRVIRGKQTFTRRYGINRWNMNTLDKQPVSDIFQPAWLAYLADDYKVSPQWLIQGQGEFYQPEWDAAKVAQIQKNLRATCELETQ